jgi:hypothetical protein
VTAKVAQLHRAAPAQRAPRLVVHLTEADIREIIREELAGFLEQRTETALPKPLTASELAEAWNVSERTIRSLRKKAGLPCLMVGDSPRFYLAECERWARERGNE